MYHVQQIQDYFTYWWMVSDLVHIIAFVFHLLLKKVRVRKHLLSPSKHSSHLISKSSTNTCRQIFLVLATVCCHFTFSLSVSHLFCLSVSISFSSSSME